jgi:hypothetical protein
VGRTFGDYGASALIGAIPAADRGTVCCHPESWCAVAEARRRRDRPRILLARLSTSQWPYEPDRPAVARAQALSVSTAGMTRLRPVSAQCYRCVALAR